MSQFDIGEAIETAKDAAAVASTAGTKAAKAVSFAWGDLVTLGKNVAEVARSLGDYRPRGLLGMVGLYRRPQVMPLFGAFAAGVTVGAGVMLLVAPKSGRDTRALIAELSKKLMAQTRTGISETTDKVATAAKKLSDRTRSADPQQIMS